MPRVGPATRPRFPQASLAAGRVVCLPSRMSTSGHAFPRGIITMCKLNWEYSVATRWVLRGLTTSSAARQVAEPKVAPLLLRAGTLSSKAFVRRLTAIRRARIERIEGPTSISRHTSLNVLQISACTVGTVLDGVRAKEALVPRRPAHEATSAAPRTALRLSPTTVVGASEVRAELALAEDECPTPALRAAHDPAGCP